MEIDPANQINRFNNLNQKKMKKFYAILAASLVVGTASAAAPKMNHVGAVEAFNPQMATVVEKAHADLLSGVTGESFVMKSKKAASTETYLVRACLNQQRFIDLIAADMTFEERPFYWYTISFQNEAGSIAVFDYILPCISYMTEDLKENSDYFDADGNFNWTKAAETYGSLEAAQRAATLQEICELTNQYYMPEYPYGYLGPYSCWAYNTSTWQKTDGYYLRAGIINAQGKVEYDTAGKEAARVTLSSYDPETGDFEGAFYAPMGTRKNVGTSSDPEYAFDKLVGTLNPGNDEITSSALVTGWEPNKMNVGEVHIFNLGTTSADYELGTYDEEAWTVADIYDNYEPAQMYYVAFCGPELTYEGKIEEAELPVAPSIKSSDYTVDQVNWFAGHFTLAPNADPENTYPEGLVDLEGYTAKNSYVADTFGPGTLFSAYYIKAAEDSKKLAGMLGNLGQFYNEMCIPYYIRNNKTGALEAKTVYSFGNKDMGFNGHIVGDSGAIVEFIFKGDINYHYDESDYRVSKKISAIGNSNDSALGVKTIAGVSDAETVATEYYNFQGLRLNEAPVKGMYIVREYKADGTVVAKKVAK